MCACRIRKSNMNEISKYDYKSIIEMFCEQAKLNKNEKRILLSPELYNKDLFEMYPDELGELILEAARANSVSFFKLKYWLISSFFEWCVDKYTPLNVYKELELLSYRNLLYQMAEQSTVTVIYDYELRRYADISLYNKELHAVIIGLLYDGVANLTELASIKWEQIDLLNGIVKIKRREIKLSEFSLKSLKKYKDIDEYEIETANKQTYVAEYITHKNFLLKVVKARHNPDITDKKYVKQKVDACSMLLKKIGISYFDITKSGALNALREVFKEYSNQEFCKVFFREPPKKLSRKEGAIVSTVVDIYGGGENGIFVDSCIPFVIKSKYFRDR